ncbi:MAG: HlyD family efflux transporter periplasmic adaptor subunit [candidate division Zixibacteria bacterium]|nr:HlyD family efflux transporter periplasmic adaptor subunit [candidate division Zixibacteria bacterium]
MFRRVFNKPNMKRFFIAGVLSVAASALVSCGGNNDGIISATGTIEASEASVSSKVTGEIKAIPVEEGSLVHQGDTLVIIDRSTLDIQLRQAKAGYEFASAQLEKLLNGARVEDINQAEDALKQAEANLKVAESNYNRMKDLFDKNSITRQKMDDAEAAYTIARARCNSAKQAYNKIMNWARPEEIRAARAQTEQSRAAVDLIEKSISDSYVTAPISGTVTQLPVDVGELVGQGAVVSEISKTDTVDLMIYIPEPKLGMVKYGQRASITIDTYPDREFEGKVVYISPEAEFTPKNIQTKEDRVKLVYGVKIKIPNPDDILKPGMPADAEIHTGNNED